MNEALTHDTQRRDNQRRDNPWVSAAARVHRVVFETEGVKTYDLEFVDRRLGSEFRFAPGQFNMLNLPGVGEAAISIAGQSEGGLLRHTIRSVGVVTTELDRGGVGMSLGIRGPFGTPWPVDQFHEAASEPRDNHKANVILVAGGIGLAPLRSVIHHLIRHRDLVGRVDVLMGARNPADLLYAKDYPKWAEHGIPVRTTVDRASDQWRGHVGVVTLLLDRLLIPHPRSTVLMTCGPEVMIRYVVQAALERGVPETNIWVSLERNMNCGIGLCGHCQFGPEFLCKDGPVFRYDRVASWLRVQEL
jgi:NAD(P)H-flavin reductase